ncbi:MAG: class I mannose-6-phosphate isomerase [Epulopiscium sp.]|nr:class I mannose-6-phosphate isomerase [Candidatus Epulonipiscium sp.]
MFYPIKFQPIYKSMIWGGDNIAKKFNRQVPEGKIGESWEICCREDGMSIVSNGSLKGKSFEEIIKEHKEDLLGKDVYDETATHLFPLLIKIIDATDNLSVQVHPDDEYAAKHNDSGKTELWYVLDTKPGASLIYGLKEGMTKEEFTKAVEEGNIKDTLNEIEVKPGDVIFIPAGTVHALLDGVMIAEIQQNSNVTYRLYDWDRLQDDGTSRELHVEDALNVIDFDRPLFTPNDGACFTVEEVEVDGLYYSKTDGSTFYVYMVTEGSGVMKYEGGEESLSLGDTVLVPATMGGYSIEGELKVLEVF